MIKRQILVFLLRTVALGAGLWLCITLFGTVSDPTDTIIFVSAGVIFSLINSIVKPLAKLLILPLAIITMGVSTLLINIAMLALTLYLVPGIELDLWGIIISSIILSIINSLVNLLMPAYNK